MSGGLGVMVVDDERAMRESLAAWLGHEGHRVSLAAGGEEALRLLSARAPEVMLVDIKMPGMDGLELLRQVRRRSPDTQVVMITAYGSIADAVEAMKEGAADYLLKPFDPEELVALISRLAERHRLVEENRALKERLREQETAGRGDLVAASPAMLELLELVREVAPTESPVLIVGETGTGKEMVARALHAAGPRAFGPFVPINCGAQTESLLESELFGHEKGAFTGAVRARRGRLEMADGGTLFLDEVGEISAKMQVDLLRVLEEKSFCRVGGSRPVTSDFRLAAATHRDLSALVAAGGFRQDFFYRINVIRLEVPPLRQRPEDIGLLAQHFLERYARETGKRLEELSPEALEVLAAYSWPGNVRELKNVMERAVVVARGRRVGAEELTFLQEPGPAGRAPATLAEVERDHIQRVLAAQGGNVTRAAEVLGIDRRTLTRKLKRYREGGAS
jgi:two-component system response regulator HydG